MKKTGLLLGLIGAIVMVLPHPARAQYYAFGKNKVQYDSFNWQTLRGEHVEIYYYTEEEPIARLALILAEESYADLTAKFQHEVTSTIPMIVFSSHEHFQENNVTPGFIPEGVEGFTEFLKGRVVLPFTGSYAEFQHVIHHEMVHVFQFSILEQTYKAHRKSTFVVPPLWFSEGLAEYWSTGWDAQGTMVLSDMALEGHIPDIDHLWEYDGTFTVYKLGQSLCQYIGETFGQDALRRLYTDLYKGNDFDGVIEYVTGSSVRRISEDWIHEIRCRYYPQVKERRSLAMVAQERAVARGSNLQPVAAPDTAMFGGDRYFFISARSGYTNIYSASYRGPERDVKSIVHGQRNAQFESFHPFESRISVSARGELAFVSKWNGRDALFVMDPAKKKVLLREYVGELISLSSPSWSRDGSRIAFSGLLPSGQSDLYVIHRDTGAVQRLTNDYFADLAPTWSPDGSQIAFASDRTRFGKEGHKNLFLVDTKTLEVRYLTCGPWTDQTPSWSPDGSRIAFASDRGGMFELYTVDPAGNGVRVTHTLSTALDPAWLPDGKHLLFTAFHRGGFGIYEMNVDPAGQEPGTPGPGKIQLAKGDTHKADLDVLGPMHAAAPGAAPTPATGSPAGDPPAADPPATDPPAADPPAGGVVGMDSVKAVPASGRDAFSLALPEQPPQWNWEETLARSTEEPAPYKPHYGLDLVQGGVSLATTQNMAGGLQGSFSDILGNRSYYFTLGNTATTTSQILSRMNFGVWYVNRERRWNYGVGVFHTAGDYLDAAGFEYFERRAGASLVASYPFSRFNRVDLTTEVYYDQKSQVYGLQREGILVTNSLSLVSDNTLWFPTGPRDGSRFNLTGAITTDLNTGQNQNVTFGSDVRRYFRVSQWSSFAWRMQARVSSGVDPMRWEMGGSYTMRGYPYGYFEGTRLYLVNAEYRFPLLDHMVLGVPFRGFALPGVEGAFFADAGNAWEKFENTPAPLGSFGFGLRMNLAGYMVLRYDIARRTNFHEVAPGWQGTFYIGFDY
jgi:WD40 repeat protein